MFTNAMGNSSGIANLNAALELGWNPAEEDDPFDLPPSGDLKKPEIWSQSSSSAVLITGDKTDKYGPGIKVKFNQDGVIKYFYGGSVSLSNGDTIWSLDGRGVYSVSASAISGVYFSVMENPFGWPLSLQIDGTNIYNTPYSSITSNNIQDAVNQLLNITDPLGHAKEYYGITLPARHLWADGKTIGDEVSGATARANTDTTDLYMVLWDAANVTGSQIQLYDSTGAATAKGTDAVSDFNAHKRLSLPDKRGRVGIGADNMGGTSANIVTNANANILGGTSGEEYHPLSIPEMPTHNHGGATGNDSPDHTHNIYIDNAGISAIIWSFNSGGTGRYETSSGASVRHTHSIYNQGSNAAHNNMQPWVACNYIMRY